LANQQSLDLVYMQTALLHAELSKAQRAKVGSCLVTTQGVCLTGYNGTPIGMDNICEDVVGWNINTHQDVLVTKPEVLHSELNCLMKAAREGISVVGGTIYITLSPCVQCSAMLIQAGIKRVVYLQQYRCTKGLDLLAKAGIVVDKLEI